MNKAIQPKRLLNLDLVKIIALLIMPFIHVFEEILITGDLSVGGLMGSDFPTTAVKYTMGILYIFCPTVFLFCLGAGLALTRYNSPANLARRGLFVLALSGLLNIFRYFLPYLGAYLFFGNYNEWFVEFLRSFCYSDILYIAGFTFLLAALAQKLKVHPTVVAFIAIAMALVQNFIPIPSDNSNTIANAILGNFIYVNDMSFFPLVSWLLFPVAGYHYQHYMFKAKSLDKYHLIILGAGIIGFLSIFLPLLFTGSWKIEYLLWCDVGNTQMSAITITLIVPITCAWVALFYFIANVLKNKPKLKNIVSRLSKNTTKIYFFHWIILVWLECIPRAFEYTFGLSNLWMIFVWALITIALAMLFSDLLKRKIEQHQDHLPRLLHKEIAYHENIEQDNPENPRHIVSNEQSNIIKEDGN